MSDAPVPTTEGPDRTGAEARERPPSADRPLLILAVDHRSSLERDLYGLTAPPTATQAARITADKLLVYQALLDAAAQLPPEGQPGILIDEEYGASVAELASRSSGAINLSMPIEASGEEWFHFAYGDDWRRHAEFFSTDHAKVLVRDNPGLDPSQREQQAGRLAQVSSWAASAGRPLILELLVPPTDEDNRTSGGDPRLFESAVRPSHMVTVIEYLQDHGVEPAIWKVEGLEHHDDAVAVTKAAIRGGRTATCIVLGRHAPHDKLDHWLEVAAPIPGFVGFAIGRSIWWDPLHSHLRHHSTAGEARRRITGAYLDFANYYLTARDGTLAGDDEPEFW
jgi:myo-inositol catabolism protein IolC